MLQSQETNVRELEGVILQVDAVKHRARMGWIMGLEGVIQQVDAVSRELVVLRNGNQVRFYVPIDCKILLNDERVKLRMLQPMDRACISFTRMHNHFVAHSIAIHWDSPAPRIAPSDAAYQHTVGLMECT